MHILVMCRSELFVHFDKEMSQSDLIILPLYTQHPSFVDYETEMIHSPPESKSFVHLSCESGIGHVTTHFSSRVHSTSSTGMVK